jgi:general secretion pathway protein G
MKQNSSHETDEDGFTLVELLVVLGIIALLAALLAPQVIGYLSGARSEAAAAQLKNIESAVELYYLDNGSYPPTDVGLDALIKAPPGLASWKGPYFKRANGLVDPWGKPFSFANPGIHGPYDIFSLGRDGREGGEGEDKDIVNW